MRVLVTGHKGYIGAALTPMLTKLGHHVVGFDSDLYSRCDFGAPAPAVPEIRKDIRDAERSDVEGFDVVLHLAGLSNDPLGELNPELTDEINCRATVRLAELAKDAGARRFVFSSSCSNYGAGGEDLLNEDSDLKPVTPYGLSKVKAEQGLAGLADDGFSPVYLRSATAFGVSPRLRFDLVLNNLAAWAYTTKRVRIKSDGTPWRPIVHIEDIARAFIAVMEAPREAVHDQAFNVARNDNNFRVRELADIVHSIVPDCEIEYAADGGSDKRCYRVDCSKIANAAPAFKPQWSAADGCRELYDSYRRVGLTLDEFEGEKYQRIAHVKALLRAGVVGDDLRVRRPQ